MPVLNLPDPANWRVGGRRPTVVTVTIVVFVGLGVYFAVRNLLRADPLSALVIVGVLVPFVLTLIAVQRVARGRTTLRINVDSTGTTLRADRTSSLLVMLVMATVISVGVLVVTTTVTGDLELFTSTRGRIASAALMTVATAVAVWGLVSARRRGGVGSVKLTPDGIDIANIVRTTRVQWNDVVAVDDHSASTKTRKAVVPKRTDDAESVIDGADFYVPNGAGLFWMIRHYWNHAQDRGELIDARAGQRLSESRFEAG